MAKKLIVTIGGGSGQFTLLKALTNVKDIDITAVVAMSDSGGSSGRLRDEYGDLPPGDALQCLIALSPFCDARAIFQSRFQANEHLRNHTAGNMLLTFLSQYLGRDFAGAIEAMGEILKVRGRVLPVTVDKTTLVAELSDGKQVYSESEIDIARGQRAEIVRTFLVPHNGHLSVYPKVIDVLAQADFIFIGPGDLETSITPNFLVPGVNDAVRSSRGKIAFVVNIMTKFGETDHFKASDFLRRVEGLIGRKMDFVLVNNRSLVGAVQSRYELERAKPVIDDLSGVDEQRRIVHADLLTAGELARHDVKKLANQIRRIMQQ